MFLVYPIQAFNDNYIWAIHDPQQNTVVIVDPGDAKPVIQYLQEHNLILAAILITHHHWDHTNGILELKKVELKKSELKKHDQVPVFGPATENIAGLSKPVKDGDIVVIENFSLNFQVIDIPGHTLGHIAYFATEEQEVLFCGDTLFAAGCGKLFEGTAKQMLASLTKLSSLPDTTKIFCGHEYTLNNLRFAQNIEPGNKKIATRIEQVKEMRDRNLPSLPSLLTEEKETNPFLRTHSQEIIHYLEKYTGHELSHPVDIFAALRSCKDEFQS